MNYNFLKDQHILITGGAGFIGHHLVKAIMAEQPAHLYVLDNLETGLLANISKYFDDSNFTFLEADVANPDSSASIDRLDYIFHLAAVVSVPKSFEMPFKTHRTNESGFIHILELAKRLNVKKICYASSSAVYGEQQVMPIAETAALNPQSPYGLSKLLNEQYAEAFFKWEDISSMGFRFFNVFGPGQRADSPYSGVISIFIDKMQKSEPVHIFGDGQQIRDFVFVEDVVQALLLGALSGQTLGVFNVGSGQNTSLNELFDMLKSLTNYQLEPTHKAARKGDIRKSAADIELIVDKLAFTPKFDLKEGLKSLLEIGD